MIATEELSPESEAKLAEYKSSITAFFASFDHLTQLVDELNCKVTDMDARLNTMDATIAAK